MSDIFTLYRFFDSSDALLYIGRTVNPGRRMEKHRDTQPWWSEVTRITMEQQPDLSTLCAAERQAIESEKPLHNVRMNERKSSHDVLPAAVVENPIDGLVGRWFHSWRPISEGQDTQYSTVRDGRTLEWQGEILERVEHELYLVQTYSWLDGGPYSQELISVREMAGWTFYGNHIEMIADDGCGEYRSCGRPVEYFTVNRGLGCTAVCSRHAGYYGHVRPIIWRKGKATLGKETTVKHPLAGVDGRPA